MAGVFSRKYDPGDLIYKSKPYVKVIRRDLWDKVCACCLKRNVYLKRCTRCKMVKYCGPSCQKAAWKDHKLECPFLPKYEAGPHHYCVLMVGSLILKTKGKDWKSITDEVLEQKVSFDDLKYQSYQLSRLQWSNIVVQEIATSLKSYLGEENVPDEETLRKLIGKVECNHYSFGESETESWALFIGPSKFDHSCVPNANIHFNGNTMQIRAIKKIDENEKITFSYCPKFFCFDVSALHSSMKNSFGEGGCKCSDCSQPYGQSTLTKILNPTQAVPILEETEGILLMASLMARFRYPMQWFTQARLRQLLERQEGVLGDTHLARIRLLALKCLLLGGNYIEMREELTTLVSWVKLAWGENCAELTEIYKKLISINMILQDLGAYNYYLFELARLKTICMGEEDATKEAYDNFRNLYFHFSTQ